MPNDPTRIEIITSRERRRRYSAEQKLALSNGASEAFVKTFKRDYARVQPRPDALTVLAQLPAWIEDCNECHPHGGLRMRSPREFLRQQFLSKPTGEREPT